MPRKTFFSFHYIPDNWRVAQVRNIGAVEDSPAASDNAWETIKKGGDAAIQRWIDGQLSGRTCAIVLIGAETANRKWINYEIDKAWNAGMGVFGIYIHNLKNAAGQQSIKGNNPFDYRFFSDGGAKASTVIPAHDPPFSRSTDVYTYIANNLESWVESAINQRQH